MSSTARGCRQVAVGLAFAGLVSSVAVWSQDDPARLRAAALTQQGDLLQQQAATLQPRTRELERRGAALAAEAKQLAADVAVVERLVREYNAEVGALAATVNAQREHCTSGPLVAQEIAECNTQGADLTAQAGLLEQRREKLDERQRTLNQSIDRHNARRLEWERAKREHDTRRDANESDLRQWLQRARAFWSSDGFAPLSQAAGSPSVCSSAQLAAADAAHLLEAVKRMQLCLKAVAR